MPQETPAARWQRRDEQRKLAMVLVAGTHCLRHMNCSVPTSMLCSMLCSLQARLLCSVAVLAAALAFPVSAVGMQIEGGELLTEEQADEAVRDSLGGRTRYPFYDRAKDDTRRLNVESPRDADSANRQSKWAGKKAAARKNAPPPRTGMSGPLGAVLQVLGLTALVVFIGILAWLIARAFLKQETTETVVSKVVETSRDVDRVEALPFAVRKPTGDFESEARRLYEAGQFSEAIIYLYSHLLVQLDRHHVIRLAKGKTNRQYLRETRGRPVLREILDRTMIAFEDVFFGHHQLSREAFEACWRRLDEFHAELDRGERAAA